MKTRKFGQAALDAIDASLVDAEWYAGLQKYKRDRRNPNYNAPDNGKWSQTIAELRSIRRVIVAAGKVDVVDPDFLGAKGTGEFAKAILNARAVESKRA